ncbi:MAG: IS200/IS605 family transposase [Filimonas sp.]|nr:IS200/IS605 family transposase [Filimonas sp.]
MSNSYNKAHIYLHIIAVVKDKQPLLAKTVRHVMLAQLDKAASQKAVQLIKAGGVEDHLHFLLQLHPMQSATQVVKLLKEEVASWVNENKLLKEVFEWEEGATIYSVSPTSVDKVIEYISKQENYHTAKTLAEELDIFEKAIQ